MAENERPPPVHQRLFLSLRETFVPAAFRSTIRYEWDRFKTICHEERERLEIESPAYRASLEQRRIAKQIGRSGNPVMVDLRRYWAAGKPRKPFPPANE
jgi:hypothetical protein